MELLGWLGILGLLLPILVLGIRRYVQGPIYQSNKRMDGKTAVITGANTGRVQ